MVEIFNLSFSNNRSYFSQKQVKEPLWPRGQVLDMLVGK